MGQVSDGGGKLDDDSLITLQHDPFFGKSHLLWSLLSKWLLQYTYLASCQKGQLRKDRICICKHIYFWN